MPAYPELTTDRLHLSGFELTDAPEVRRLAGERAIAATTLNIPHPYDDRIAEEWIKKHGPAFEKDEAVSFAITVRETGVLVGAIGLHLALEHRRAELGYWVGRPYWGCGYATEAGQAVLRYAFEVLQLNRVYARHFARNPESGGVLQKLGMKYEGCQRQHVDKWGVFEDLINYGLLRSEYQTLCGPDSTE